MKTVLSWPAGSFSGFRLAAGLGLACLALAGNLWGFVGVTPPVVELFARPGQVVKGKLTISNSQEDTVVVNSEVKDWWTQATGIPSPGIDQWLKVAKVKDVKLLPQEKKSVKYRVKVPKDAQGEFMAMIFFNIHSKRDPSGKPTNFNLEMRHGAPIYVIVQGTEQVQAETKEVASHFVNESSTSPIEFFLTFKNTGNVHVRPYGSVTIYKDNAVKDAFELESGWPIYPGQEHRYFAKSKVSGWTAGAYQAAFHVTAGAKGALFDKRVLLDKKFSFRVTAQGKTEMFSQ